MAMSYQRPIRRGGIPAGAKALMVLIALVTLLAVWLVPDEHDEAPPSLPEIAPPAREETAVPLPVPAQDAEQPAIQGREGDSARAIVAELRAGKTEINTPEVFDRAEQMQSEGRLDDAYLLYRVAARQGHARAAFILATQADPAYYSETSSALPGPDAQQAYKWYQAAAAAGYGEATPRLQQLRAHVEQAAANGDAAAQRLMLQWQ
jgi:hypothetical protein